MNQERRASGLQEAWHCKFCGCDYEKAIQKPKIKKTKFCSKICKSRAAGIEHKNKMKTSEGYRNLFRARVCKRDRERRVLGITKRLNEKKKNRPEFVLQKRLRGRLWELVRKRKTNKLASAIELVGCSIAELKLHLENQFKVGMTWKITATAG